jgi:hypothetical protein
MRRLAAVAVVTATVALAACGGSSSGEWGPPQAPTGADEVVVRVVTEGGFTAESRRPAHLPQLSVFGDRRVVVTGPTALQYPGPALPNLQEFRVTRAGLARILEAARAAGLLDDAVPDYGDPGVTDQATTTVTVRADGITRRVNVYALGFRSRVSGVTPEQSEQRDRLQQFIELAGDAEAFGDDVVPQTERRYEPTALAVRVEPADASDGETHAWPLGELAGAECAVHTGADVARALDVARAAHDGDVWESAGATYTVTFRPLLPDERTCADLSPKR